ncbi:MAG: hypothetical protein HQK89_00815 [Nitrospirae bacterium]|nr:hypothetical protein [Nitrospirota bacterium]
MPNQMSERNGSDKIIDVYIDSHGIRIDDEPTQFKFIDHYLEKLRKGESLDRGELERLGRNIYDNVFATQKRRGYLASLIADVGNHGLLTIRINSEEEWLHDVPFELMNRDGTESGFLLRSNNINIVRDVSSLNKSPKPILSPVKMLVLLSSPVDVYRVSPLDPLKELKLDDQVFFNGQNQSLDITLSTLYFKDGVDSSRTPML